MKEPNVGEGPPLITDDHAKLTEAKWTEGDHPQTPPPPRKGEYSTPAHQIVFGSQVNDRLETVTVIVVVIAIVASYS